MATRADFYLIDAPRFRARPAALVAELARKCVAQARLPTLVLVEDEAAAADIDAALWDFDAEAFVPHQVAGREPGDAGCPVLVVPAGTPAPPRPLVINLRAAPVDLPCERILEVVPAEPAHREASRRRWAAYRELGHELNKHDM